MRVVLGRGLLGCQAARRQPPGGCPGRGRAPEEVLRFMRAYVEAVHFLKTRREETIAILHNNWANMPMEEIAYLYDEVVDDYLALPIPADEAVLAIVEREADPATLAQVKPADFYDASFLRQIEQSGFLRELYR